MSETTTMSDYATLVLRVRAADVSAVTLAEEDAIADVFAAAEEAAKTALAPLRTMTEGKFEVVADYD